MSDVIHFPNRPLVADTLIIEEPMCFRRADWASAYPVQVHRHSSELHELNRAEAAFPPGGQTPPHLVLRGSLARTLTGLYYFRKDEEAMKKVFFLAGLMELATALPHQVMRTDLIRRVFQRIDKLSDEMGVRWHSGAEGFLLPLGPDYQPREGLGAAVTGAETLKKLLLSVQAETDHQFRLACGWFVYYLPGRITS